MSQSKRRVLPTVLELGRKMSAGCRGWGATVALDVEMGGFRLSGHKKLWPILVPAPSEPKMRRWTEAAPHREFGSGSSLLPNVEHV